MKLHQKISANQRGRDFVVGDIHGCFSMLRSLMKAANFDTERDRLFSVGDLVDRGPESIEVLSWLEAPWFIPVLGNHEKMLIDFAAGDYPADHYAKNGGLWALNLEDETLQRIAKEFRDLPVAITLEGRDGSRIGIVHAECPRGASWSLFTNALDTEPVESYDQGYVTSAIWSRTRIREKDATPVAGLDALYVGHTPLTAPKVLGNVFYIDTGACSPDGLMTMATIGNPENQDVYFQKNAFWTEGRPSQETLH